MAVHCTQRATAMGCSDCVQQAELCGADSQCKTCGRQFLSGHLLLVKVVSMPVTGKFATQSDGPCALLLQAVEEVLQELHLRGNQAVAAPSWHFEDVRDGTAAPVDLQQALTTCYDLR